MPGLQIFKCPHHVRTIKKPELIKHIPCTLALLNSCSVDSGAGGKDNSVTVHDSDLVVIVSITNFMG